MRCEWKEVELSEVADLTVGFVGTMASHYTENGILFLRSTNIEPFNIKMDDVRYISPEFNETIKKSQLNPDDVVIVRTGKPGACTVIPQKTEPWNCSDLVIIHPNKEKINPHFLASYINLASGVINAHLVGAVQQHFNVGAAKKMKIPLPPIHIQNRIASIIQGLNDKIELNNKINENLLEQVFSLYRNMFIETVNDQRLVCRASAYFDISIGKTPPRKEQQWFSNQPTDCVWVSIADMGNCGVYISDSSEYLTHEAVERFNVKLIPSNTVILSFKLTVGRVAITDGIMTTNEAIAHFKTEIPAINEYLYCYLKEFNYETMGSTSSIATAVNSKIIKGMPFVVPTNEELNEFHNLATPLFMMIKSNQRENKNMSELRDTLLPKLLNGEINV